MSAEGVAGFLPWVVPALLGALVGFCSAWVLACLLTRPSVLSRLSSPGARRSPLRGAVSRITEAILQRPLSDFLPAAPQALSDSVRRTAASLLAGLVSSPSFLRAVRETVSAKVASLSARTVKDVMGAGGLARFLSETVLARLAEQENRAAIARSIGAVIEGTAGSPPGGGSSPALSRVLRPFVPVAVDRLVEGLRSEETRAVLAARGRELLPRILEKLNVLQRFLLSAGQFDRRLDEKMPEIVDETIRAVEQVARDPRQQDLFLDKLVESVRDWRGSPGGGSPAGPAAALVEQALERFSDPEAREKAVRAIEDALGGPGQSLGSALRQRFGLRDSDAADAAANAVLAWFSRPVVQRDVAQRLAAFVCRFIEENAAVRVRDLLKVDAPAKDRLDELVTERAGNFAAEDRRWSAAARRWAGVFGAGLGLAIGVLDAVLRLLRLA